MVSTLSIVPFCSIETIRVSVMCNFLHWKINHADLSFTLINFHSLLIDFSPTDMSDPICQLMEDIEGLCKRCYYLQKSNNDMYGKKSNSSFEGVHL